MLHVTLDNKVLKPTPGSVLLCWGLPCATPLIALLPPRPATPRTTVDRRLVDYVSSLFAKRRIRVLTNTSVARVEKNVAFLQVRRWLYRRVVVVQGPGGSNPLTRLSFHHNRTGSRCTSASACGARASRPRRSSRAWGTRSRRVRCTCHEWKGEHPSCSTLRPHYYPPTGRGGRLLVDARLRLIGHADKGVFALGDCAVSQGRPLPPLAQAANQVGWWFSGFWTIGSC